MKNKFSTFRNNAYAVKTVWGISKSRVINEAFRTLIGYAEWIFFSTFFMRYIINAIESEKEFSEIMAFIIIASAVLVGTALYQSYSNAIIMPFTGNKIYRKLYERLYKKARNVELRCFEDSEFYNKYTMALDNAAEKMIKSVDCFFSIIFGMVATGASFYLIFAIDKFAVLFVIFPIIGNFFFGRLMNRVWSGRYEDSVKDNRRADYVNRVMYLSEFAKEIRFSNIHSLMMRRYDDSVKGIQRVADKYAKRAIFRTTMQNLFTFPLIFEGIMIYAAYRTIVSQTMGLAELAIMFSAMVASSWILIGLFGNIVDALKNGVFLKYFRAFVEYEERIPENQDGIIPQEVINSIEFCNVSFEYTEGKPVINNLSFKIYGNKIAAFVGHNGAGKTTLIKLLFRLYDPTSGEILVNDVNIKEYNLKAYRKLFSAAFQDYRVMSMTVKENIFMGIEVDDKVAESALKNVGLWDKIQSLPNGMDTILTKEFDSNGAVLSGGEVQKIIIARAFAQKASAKVFDEPSSALDPIAEYELYKGIMRESKGHNMTLFVSHRLSSVKDADIVFMLENGAVIESGTHAELMNDKSEYYEMFTKQAENYLALDSEQDYREGVAI